MDGMGDDGMKYRYFVCYVVEREAGDKEQSDIFYLDEPLSCGDGLRALECKWLGAMIEESPFAKIMDLRIRVLVPLGVKE